MIYEIGVKKVYHFKNGYCDLLTQAGLGIDVNEQFIQQQNSLQTKWRNPIWRNKDGSFAEW